MNSCLVDAGRIRCANSNYPQTPMGSSIEVFDPISMDHVSSHSLGLLDEGSLTWFDRHGTGWIAGFSHYDKNGGLPFKDHSFSSVVSFDAEWRRHRARMAAVGEVTLERMAAIRFVQAGRGSGLGRLALYLREAHEPGRGPRVPRVGEAQPMGPALMSRGVASIADDAPRGMQALLVVGRAERPSAGEVYVDRSMVAAWKHLVSGGWAENDEWLGAGRERDQAKKRKRARDDHRRHRAGGRKRPRFTASSP